jgi:hypothetical protein
MELHVGSVDRSTSMSTIDTITGVDQRDGILRTKSTLNNFERKSVCT